MTNHQIFENREIFGSLELFLLAPMTSLDETLFACSNANSHQIPLLWVKPCYVTPCIDALKGSHVNVGTVIGYPYGANVTRVKTSEAKQALIDGVTSLAMVINYGYVNDGNLNLLGKEIQAVCGLAHMNGARFSIFLDFACILDQEYKEILSILADVCVDGVILSGKALNDKDIVTQVKDLIKTDHGKFILTGMAEHHSIATIERLLDFGYSRVGIYYLPEMFKDLGFNQ